MRERVKEALPAVAGLILFVVALEVLRHELRAVSWATLTDDILNTPPRQLVSAVVLTLLNYAVLTGYDFIAFAYIGKSIAAVAHCRRLVRGLRHRQQRRLRDAVRAPRCATASTPAGA